MDSQAYWTLAHILLLVFWLGADLGVLILAREVRRADLSFEQRAVLLRMALVIDTAPRVCFALMFPVGLQLAAGLGLIRPGVAGLSAAWVVALGWLALLLAGLGSEGSPREATLLRATGWLQAVLGSACLALGAASLLGFGPFAGTWLALKVLLFGAVFRLAALIDRDFAPIGPAFARLQQEGSQPDIESAIRQAVDASSRWVLALYATLVVMAWLGTVKPF